MKQKTTDDPSITKISDEGLGQQIAGGRQPDEIFRVVVEATPNAIVLASAQGRILLVNAGAEKLFGYARGELIGQPVEMLLPERLRAAHPGHRTAYADHAETRSMGKGRDLFARRKDGSEVPVEIGLNPIETAEGLLILSVIIDITERKRAEGDAAQLAAIVESSDDAIIGKDLRGTVTSWNAGAEKMFGYSPSEMIGHSITRLIPPERQEEEMRILLQIERGESVRHFETVRVCKDGGVLNVSVTVSAIKDSAGKVVGASKVARDITEQKRMEQSLRESEDLFSKTFWLSPDCVALQRVADGTILKANEAICRLWGTTPPEVVGKTADDYSFWLSEAERDGFMRKLEEEGECLNYETTLRMNDGRLVQFRISSRVIVLNGESCLLTVRHDTTEEKRTEKALSESELRYRRLFESAKDGILILDATTGMVVDVNPFLMTTLGYSREQFMGKAIWDLGFFKDTWANEAKFAELREKEYVRYEHLPLETIGGQKMEVEFVSNVYLVNGSKVIQCNVRDVTARRKTEEDVRQLNANLEQRVIALRRSEAEFRGMTEASPLGIFVTDCAGLTTYTNATLRQMLGTGFQEMAGSDWARLVHPLDRAELVAQWQEAVAHQQSFEGNARFVRSDGRTIQTGIKTAVMRDGDRVLGFVGVVEDITERKRAEERLSEQASMLNRARDAILVRGFHDRQLSFWNKGAETLYGWTAAEAIGRDIGELIFADRNKPDEITGQLLKTDEWRGETRHKTKDGKKLIVNTRATLLRDAAGHPKSVLTINTDMTGQKALEAQFLRAQRMESIGTLAGGIAHDLNNILSPIMMSVQVLRMKLTDEQREGVISTIEMSAERGAQIVKQVLTFGRGLEGEKRPLQVGALLGELVKIMRETFPREITIDRSMAGDLWIVLGDATQLHQVLLNLCVNARDAMPDGGSLRLRASNLAMDESYASMLPEARPGPYVLLEVSDNGSGIPEEIVERIFDPFFTTKEVGKGTGLGLSTVLGIVRGHGGFLKVVSEPGKGTTFQVYLPAAPEQDAAPATAALAAPPAGHGELVLVVDDEPAVASAARTVLEPHGYRVLLAADGTEALGVFAQNSESIALVLTDIMMPHMSGVTLVRALQKMKPGIPVIASTGLGEKAHLAELKAMGIETILNKPYSADTLLRTIHGMLHPPSDEPENVL
jgi:PAS domain S-box-containing protein